MIRLDAITLISMHISLFIFTLCIYNLLIYLVGSFGKSTFMFPEILQMDGHNPIAASRKVLNLTTNNT